jgi:hypothetical protein
MEARASDDDVAGGISNGLRSQRGDSSFYQNPFFERNKPFLVVVMGY